MDEFAQSFSLRWTAWEGWYIITKRSVKICRHQSKHAFCLIPAWGKRKSGASSLWETWKRSEVRDKGDTYVKWLYGQKAASSEAERLQWPNIFIITIIWIEFKRNWRVIMWQCTLHWSFMANRKSASKQVVGGGGGGGVHSPKPQPTNRNQSANTGYRDHCRSFIHLPGH